MDLTMDNWRFFAGAPRFLEGKAAGEYQEGYTSYIRRDPIGVIGSIAPWNPDHADTLAKPCYDFRSMAPAILSSSSSWASGVGIVTPSRQASTIRV